jgi:hypothetical protein
LALRSSLRRTRSTPRSGARAASHLTPFDRPGIAAGRRSLARASPALADLAARLFCQAEVRSESSPALREFLFGFFVGDGRDDDDVFALAPVDGGGHAVGVGELEGVDDAAEDLAKLRARMHHPVEVRHLPVGVGDDREVRRLPLGRPDVLGPFRVRVHRMESPIAFTPRRSNSGLSRATYPSSVVQTGVKSRGWEKRIANDSPTQLLKRRGPCVLSAEKSERCTQDVVTSSPPVAGIYRCPGNP